MKKTRKAIIFEEAAKLFKEKGYRATSMRDIAQRVNLEPSSLYSHIKSKDELLRKICFDCADRFMNGISLILESEHGPVQQMEQVIDLHINVAFEEPMSVTVFNDEWRNLPEPDLTEFKILRRHYEQALVGILNRGIQQGKFRSEQTEILMNAILSSFRWIQLGSASTDKWQINDIKQSLTSFILNGLKK